MFRLTSLVAIVATGILGGCGGSPTRGSTVDEIQAERIVLYSGQWRAVIGDSQVVVQIQAVHGFFAPDLNGTGTAVNRTTGQTCQLKIYGYGTLVDDFASASGSFFNIALADEVTAGGTTMGALVGQFTGHIRPDRRTWEGRYRPWADAYNFVDIFGVQDVAVTFTKD